MSIFVGTRDATVGIGETFTPGPKTGLVENFIATFQATVAADLTNSRQLNLLGAYDDILGELNKDRKFLDRQFVNPFGQSFNEGPKGFVARNRKSSDELEDEIFAEIAARRAEDPAALPDLPVSRADLLEGIAAEVIGELSRAEEIGARATLPGSIGRLAGGFAGVFTDPINLATLPFGAALSTGILRTAIIEAGINVGIEVASIPALKRYREELGFEFTAEDALRNLTFAGGAGFLFGGAIKAARVGRLKLPRDKSLRDLADDLAAGSRRKLMATFDRLVKRPTPTQKAARADLEREVTLDDANPFEDTAPARAEHRERTAAAVEAAAEGRAPDIPEEPVSRPVPRPREVPRGALDQFDPGELRRDARAFQFKSDTDAKGVSQVLRGVERFDENKANLIFVWERADGELFVADGFQRVSLAKRLIESGRQSGIRLNGIRFREVDGISREQLRLSAAEKNIAEGTGTVIDVAKVFRLNPDVELILPPRSRLVRDGKPLANLSDETFGLVVNEIVPADHAAIVGRLVPDDEDLQRAIMEVLSRVAPANAVEAESIVRQALDAGTTRSTQSSLFGDREITESLFLERARVLDRTLKALKRDRTVFRTLTRDEGTIEGAGNRLARDENLKRQTADAQAIETLAKLANRKGPLADALTAAARDAKADGNFTAAARRFTTAVRAAAARGDLSGVSLRATGRSDGSPGQIRQLSQEPEQRQLDDFLEPAGRGQDDQAAALEAELRSTEDPPSEIPIGEFVDDAGVNRARTVTREELLDELDADREFLEQLELCE